MLLRNLTTWSKCLAFLYTLTLIVCFDSGVMASSPVVLKYASTTPSVGFIADWEKWLANEIEKRTNGRVKMQIFFGGSLLKIPEGLDGVKKGVADIALIPPLWFPGELPLFSFTQVTGLAPEPDVVRNPHLMSKAVWKLWDEVPEIRKELERWNQTAFSVRAMPPYQLWSRVPIRKLSDLNKLKVRELGIRGRILFGTYGAIPTSVTPAEMYGALQKGVIDAAVASFDWGELYRLKEVARNLIVVDFNPGAPFYTINMETLNRLSPKDREILMKLGRDFTSVYADALSKYIDELMTKFKNEGVNIIRFPAEERERWKRECEPKLIDAWLKELKGVNMEEAKKVIEAFLSATGGKDVIPWRK